MTDKIQNALKEAQDALEEAEGYSFGNATAGEHQRRRKALTTIRAALEKPAPDLEKIAEALEGLKKPPLGASVRPDQIYRDAFNAAIDAAIELIKQAGRG